MTEEEKRGVGRPHVLEGHKYRQQIEDLLIGGYTPGRVNQSLGKMYPDYIAPALKTLYDWREERLKERVRVRKEFERVLAEEQFMTDVLQDLSVQIELQRGRVQRILDIEKEKGPGKMIAEIGFETDRLVNYLMKYREVFNEEFGSKSKAGTPVNLVVGQQVIGAKEYMEQVMAGMSEEAKQKIGDIMRQERLVREEAEVEVARKSMLPAPTEDSKRQTEMDNRPVAENLPHGIAVA